MRSLQKQQVADYPFQRNIDESIPLLYSTVKTLKRHIHIKCVHFNFYNDVKNNLTFTWILVKVTKTNNNGKSGVLVLVTPRSVYSLRVAISVMLRIK